MKYKDLMRHVAETEERPSYVCPEQFRELCKLYYTEEAIHDTGEILDGREPGNPRHAVIEEIFHYFEKEDYSFVGLRFSQLLEDTYEPIFEEDFYAARRMLESEREAEIDDERDRLAITAR